MCDLPKLQDLPETYAPRLVIDDEIYYASAPLQVIKPRKVQHKLCQCLVMWKCSEFILEYLRYYTDLHGMSHTIILAQDSETMASLKWLQALYSIELILWSHLYTHESMTSYCTLLAQQQCEWVAQCDVDEFLHLLDNARLVDYLQDIPSNAHSVLLKLHFVQMFANQTVLRTPVGGVLRNCRCNIDSMVPFKTLLKTQNAHSTYVNKVHYYFGKKYTIEVIRGTNAHYAIQSWMRSWVIPPLRWNSCRTWMARGDLLRGFWRPTGLWRRSIN